MRTTNQVEAVTISSGTDLLNADLRMVDDPRGLVIFAHGSGSSRFSTRNRHVAEALGGHRFATLLLDLLTVREERVDAVTAEHRFDVDRLGRRVCAAMDWAATRADLSPLAFGCFGASTGAAAALIAAAARPDLVGAVVSRGGRPDLAGEALGRVKAPTLLIVGGNDEAIVDVNRRAMRQMRGEVTLEIVPGASHLFEESGALDRVASLAADWFERHLERAADR